MLTPFPASKWNYRTAAHLLSRAGFGGTPADIEKLARLGPEKAVGWLVDFEKVPDPTAPPTWAKKEALLAKAEELAEMIRQVRSAKTGEERSSLEEKRRLAFQQAQREQQRQIIELRAWWLRRMAKGPWPLQEKLTLFWHGHFATSAQKVRVAYLMYLQNET